MRLLHLLEKLLNDLEGKNARDSRCTLGHLLGSVGLILIGLALTVALSLIAVHAAQNGGHSVLLESRLSEWVMMGAWVCIALGIHRLTLLRPSEWPALAVIGAILGAVAGLALSGFFRPLGWLANKSNILACLSCVPLFAIGLPLLDLGATFLRRRIWPENFEAGGASAIHATEGESRNG